MRKGLQAAILMWNAEYIDIYLHQMAMQYTVTLNHCCYFSSISLNKSHFKPTMCLFLSFSLIADIISTSGWIQTWNDMNSRFAVIAFMSSPFKRQYHFMYGNVYSAAHSIYAACYLRAPVWLWIPTGGSRRHVYHRVIVYMSHTHTGRQHTPRLNVITVYLCADADPRWRERRIHLNL